MSEHMLVYVDRVMRPVLAEPSSLTVKEDNAVYVYDGDTFATEMWSAECRICQEESAIMNLESPCACNGSLKSYQAGYTSPPPPLRSEETTIDIGGGWTISGLDLDDPHLMAIAEAERQILESEYDDHTAPDTSLAAFFRISALILMTLLLRCALTIPDYADGEDEDTSSILSLFLLRAATFLLPCYIMASAISILHRRRQRQEAVALATRFALVLSSRQPRAMINYLSMEP
ncbi:hypothetical protein BRARA_F00952 [Brassica rapa]|uniref:RING-CH-type domain-containing protein n=1 Tax=Brassica campestris TaxID=3711 RepID=M4DT25_BRACM|nr:hypothetical protein BRARA_F00952 [Brassica rapa]